MMGKILKTLIIILLGVVGLVVVFLGWQMINEFKPEAEYTLMEAHDTQPVPDSLTIISWNTGYFGLGAEMDFFYEGGSMVRPTEEQYNRYRKEALQRIISFNTADFIFLQEVDTMSRRSFFDNQLKHIRSVLPEYTGFFATNYNAWVPVPLTNPMGKVRAGIVTMTKQSPAMAKSYYFDASYDFPMRLFMLKRCYLEMRFKASDNNELVIINIHNSAFADATALREAELNALHQKMMDEYNKGNYIVIGGDWNQNPPPFDTATLLPLYNGKYITPGIAETFAPPGWTYAFDPQHTTNREVNQPYNEGQTYTSLIDFYILSPNIKLLEVKTLPNGFNESDHQPVKVRFKLERPKTSYRDKKLTNL